MNLLRGYIRELFESTQYDSKFKPLMDSGYDGIKQAMELADQLGIPSQELPWELKHIDEYLDKIFDPTLDDLEATGWSMEEYRAADWGGGEYENFERKLGLRESTQYDSKFKPLMDSGYEGIKQALELADSMGMSSQDLPWDHDTVMKYMMYGPESEVEGVLFVVGWSKKKLRDEGQKAHEEYRSKYDIYGAPLQEATKYDKKFLTLMDAGHGGIKDAMFLADSLGIPSQELPWTNSSISDYLYYEAESMGIDLNGPGAKDIYTKLLANTGWTWEEWVSVGTADYEAYERDLGLREAIRGLLVEQSMGDKEKVIMLFFKESSRLGIQMAEMTPGLEELAKDLDDFRDQVDGFVDKAERLVRSQGKYQERNQYTISDLMSLHRQIQYGMFKLTNQLTSREPSAAMSKWANELFLLVGGIQTAISPYSVGWNDKMQTKLDDLKDWARET